MYVINVYGSRVEKAYSDVQFVEVVRVGFICGRECSCFYLSVGVRWDEIFVWEWGGGVQDIYVIVLSVIGQPGLASQGGVLYKYTLGRNIFRQCVRSIVNCLIMPGCDLSDIKGALFLLASLWGA